ncbi:MAG: MotA/TolQ/ExbB proton channel family protein [Hyphomonas sp.]|nr:MotA/TolQ/ExbB proton channel family protein [Hyphomonas sp.]
MTNALKMLMEPSGIVVIPLILCSVIAVALIADRAIALATHRGLDRRTEATVKRQTLQASVIDLLATVIEARPFYADAARVLRDNVTLEKSLREEAVSLELQAAGRTLSRRLTGLTTIAGLAPLLGLLGTVIGLMVAFRSLEGTTGPVEPGIVAGGLWQAMVTTVIGLAIAVPCLVMHAWFRSQIRYRMADAAALLSSLSLAADIKAARDD